VRITGLFRNRADRQGVENMSFDPVNDPCTTGIIFGLTTSPVFAIVAIWEIHVGGHICHTNKK
jgi:hypothetical protein